MVFTPMYSRIAFLYAPNAIESKSKRESKSKNKKKNPVPFPPGSAYDRGMAKPRDYKLEYRRDHASSKSKLDRAARNRARAGHVKAGTLAKGDGKEAHHPVPLTGRGGRANGSRNQRTTAVSFKYNRSRSNKPSSGRRK